MLEGRNELDLYSWAERARPNGLLVLQTDGAETAVQGRFHFSTTAYENPEGRGLTTAAAVTAGTRSRQNVPFQRGLTRRIPREKKMHDHEEWLFNRYLVPCFP